MQGVESSHLNAGIHATLRGYYALMESTVAEALKPVLAYGKSDTLGLDAMPEITIVGALSEYDKFSIIITEECGVKTDDSAILNDPQLFRTVYLSDPTDRSAQLKELLKSVPEEEQKKPLGR